jgi:WD40 repeat protein
MVGRFKAASFSWDGKTIAAMNDEHRVGLGTTQDDLSRIKGWETATGKQVFDLPVPPSSNSFWGGAGTLLAFAPDGNHLAAASGSSLHIWDLPQGRELYAKPNLHDSQISSIAITPDGQTLASASADHTIALWDAATGKQRQRQRGHEGEVCGLVFSPDGRLLASASHNGEQSVRLWDQAGGKEIRRYEIASLPIGDGGSWAIQSWVGFAENGKVLAACCSDGTLHRWDVATGKELFNQRIRGLPVLPERHEAAFYFAHDPVFSNDGRVLAFSIAGTVYISDVTAGQLLFQFKKHVNDAVLALSPDGKTLLCRAINAIQLREVASGRELHKIDKSQGFAAAFSADGRVIAVSAGEAEATVRLFDVLTGKELLRLQGHQARISSLAFSRDGTKLASGHWDSTALIWDVSSARRSLPRKDLTPPDLERLWTELRDPDAAKGHAALWTLVAAPDQAVPFLKEHLRPVPRMSGERLRRLIADLDADDFARREEASRDLAKVGIEAEPVLRKALGANPSLEKRRRVQTLLDGLACQTEMTPDAIRQLRAIQVLEQIGTLEARQILAALATGAPAAPATRDAAAAITRLNQRASGSK